MEQATEQTATVEPFYVYLPNGDVRINLHEGQDEAVHCPERFILLLAGRQSGKTCTGPLWLHREIMRCGPGDYLCVAPQFSLMNKKVLPEFIRYFETIYNLGTYRYTDRIFQFHDKETKVFFGHGDDPESLESATAKAAWLDECGQKRFRMYSWEAIRGRLALHRGRVLMTTTPYDLGWLKSEIYDRCPRPGNKGEPDYRLINFDSLMNPAFSREEYEDLRKSLPGWRFRMFYQGQFERPAGMIYDCFDEKFNKCPRFQIPSDWKRYMGNDFGAVNTAAVYLAEDPGTKILYAYREYWHGGRTAKQHTAAMLDRELGLPLVCVGGAQSEENWRDEFKAAGLPIREPDIKEVEVGINRVYGEFESHSLVIFDDLKHTLENVMSYSRELDDFGQPTEKIEDKEKYHLADALRYVVGYLRGKPKRVWVR